MTSRRFPAPWQVEQIPGGYKVLEANGQALTVVLLASLAAGIGWIGVGPGRLGPILILTVVATAGWAAWACLTYLIGIRW